MIEKQGIERRLLALLTAVGMLLAIMAIYAAPARAHNGTVSWDCDGWTVTLANYGAGADATITVDGQVVDSETGWNSYSNSGSWDPAQTHTLQVVIDAYDDGDQPVYNLGSNSSFSPDWQNGEWSFTLNITQQSCTSTTTSPTTSSTTTSTTPTSTTPSTTPTTTAPTTTSSTTPPSTTPSTVAPTTSSTIPDEVMASIVVSVEGSCQITDGDAVGAIDVNISVDDGATVVVRDSDGDELGTFTSDGSVSVPVGATYTWDATPSTGFEFPAGAASSGSITIENCATVATLPFTGVPGVDSGMLAIIAAGMILAGLVFLARSGGDGEAESH